MSPESKARPQSTRARLLGILCLLAPLIAPAAAPGQTRPRVPDLIEGQRVYAVGPRDIYDALRNEIARLEREGPQTYYVVVLDAAGPGRGALRDYLDRLVGRWEGQAGFDRQRAVVIVVDLQGRRIIVVGGEELQERYGFRDPYIERELLVPHFYPHAQAGDPSRGLRVLVGQIDRWIADRDRELTRRREEIAARESRLRDDARAAVESASALGDEARVRLDEQAAAGLDPSGPGRGLRDASAELEAARQRLDAVPSEALGLAGQARRGFQGVLDEIARLTTLQARNDDRLASQERLAGEVASAIEAADRLGLPVDPVRRDYDAARGAIEEARRLNRTDPARAGDLIGRGEGGLRDALVHARGLPGYRQALAGREASAAAIESTARRRFGATQAAGVVDQALGRDWAAALGLLATARERSATDLRGSVAAYEQAEPALRSVRDRAARAVDRHQFATRTLPATIFGFALVLVGAVLGWLWYRRRQARAALDDQFRGFREHAVGLMERLDALRARHGKLAEDPDYAAPMTGATLALFEEVESDLNRLWERWLRVMDAWERAQGLVKRVSTFRTREFDEARGLLEREGNFEEIEGEVESCRVRVDRLDQAHEQAGEALAAFEAEGEALREALEALRAAGLTSAPYREEFDPIAAVASGAGEALRADPIAAGDALAEARAALAALAERLGRVRAELERAESIRREADAVAGRAAELRAGGLRLAEEAADPDPRLEAARRRAEEAIDALQSADPEAAAARLDEAKAALDGAQGGIERHLAAREASARDREAAAQAVARVEDGIAAAGRTLAELEAGHARKSWATVAGNLDAAQALLGEARDRLAAADRAGSGEVQGFVLAVGLAGEAAARLGRAERLLAALADWRARLSALADEVRAAFGGLDAEWKRVAAFFAANREAIGPEAARSRDAAESAHRALAEGTRGARPDWSELKARAEALRRGLAVALEQAQADVEGRRRVAERIGQVRGRTRQVETLLAREDKDRMPANKRFEVASKELAELEELSRRDPGAWDRQLRMLDEVAANLDRAEQMAGQDIRLANTANAEIAEAARIIRNARAYYSSGIAVDVRPAEGQLDRARGALKSQNYEQAIELANAAEHAAREAFDRAAYAARRRQMNVRRGQAFNVSDALVIAAAQAAAHLAGRWIEGAARGSTGGGSRKSGGSRPSGSGGGGWTSGSTGRGGWTGGADEGRW